MANEQDDLEFQKVLDSGISEMENVPYSTNYNETPNANINQQNPETTESFSIFSINYYKLFFNVTTRDVISRILMAISELKEQASLFFISYARFWKSNSLGG